MALEPTEQSLCAPQVKHAGAVLDPVREQIDPDLVAKPRSPSHKLATRT